MPTNRHESSLMNLFFELLKVALGTQDRLSRVPTGKEWMALYDEAERQAVVGVLLGGLERLPEEQLPPLEVKLQWIGMVQMMEAEYRQHVERSRELAEKVRAVGFENCVLKGVAMARYYPEPSRRQCGDIDLWTFGRRKDVMKWLRSQYEIGHNVWHNVGVEVFEDVPVEIHFHPGWLWNPFHNKRLQSFFDHESHTLELCSLATSGTQELHESSMGFKVPRLEFDAVFSLVHTYRHLIAGGVGLRHVVDYFYVLRQLQTASDILHQTSSILHQLGMLKFAGAVMWILKEVCGMSDEELLCEPNEKEGRFLLREIERGGNFGQFSEENNERGLVKQLVTMLPHYPNEILWVLPWKGWHKLWRMVNG